MLSINEQRAVKQKLDNIRNRILVSASAINEYYDHWGAEFSRKEMKAAFSPESSFNTVETITQEELQNMPIEVLQAYGFSNWSKPSIVLYPLWVVNFIEGDPEVISISGKTSTLKVCDKDTRGGCIAWGFKQ